MNKLILVLSAVCACAWAEPPSSGYSYSAPSSLLVLGGGHGGGHGGGASPLSSHSHYHAVPSGHQSSEGYHIDPHLLEKIRHIILKDEIHNEQYRQASGSSHGLSSSYGPPSHSYGPPAPVYGVPHDRIVGVELDHLIQGIQVAQYHATDYDHSAGGGYPSGGYSSGGYSSGGYSGGHGGDSYISGGTISFGGSSGGGGHGFSSGGIISSGGSFSSGGHGGSHLYTTISAPSGSYGVPQPSSSYGSPHH